MPTLSALESVIELLISLGFTRQGQTQSETVRMITAASYPLAGRETTFGGRLRFVLAGTSKRVTVGKRVVCVYQVDDGKVIDSRNFKTSDLEGIKAAIA